MTRKAVTDEQLGKILRREQDLLRRLQEGDLDYNLVLDGLQRIIEKRFFTFQTVKWGKSSEEEMNWEEAKEWCEKQGGRLPTRVELLQALEDKVEGFEYASYWSSFDCGEKAYVQCFSRYYQCDSNKCCKHYVRCVFF